MVRRDELPAKMFMPWTVPQVHYILSDSEHLSAFHKKRNIIFGLKIEPWELPGGLGFVRKRRCMYTAPIQGPAWFRTMLGGQNLVEMLDVQEMMYDPESGCMLVQIDSFMLLDGGASNLRMRHMQWLYQPVMIDDHLEICEVKTTCITDGASFKNAQLHDLPQQVEDALAGIAKEEATRFYDFALKYIGSLEEKGQLISRDEALRALMSSSYAWASDNGPCTPSKQWDVPFNLVSGALVHEVPHGSWHRDIPASHHTVVSRFPAQANNCSKMAHISEEQPGSWSGPRAAAAAATEKLMTGPVLEGVPAAGKEVDALLGTDLNSLNLATAGRSLRIKTWRSHTHDSGMSMRPFFDQRSSGDSQRTRGSLSESSSLRPLYGQRSSQDSQDTRPASADNADMGTVPHGPDKTSITAEERLLLEQLAFPRNGKQHASNAAKAQLSPKERRMVNEILSASIEADDLTAHMGLEAGTGMQYHTSYQDHAIDHSSCRNSSVSSSEYSVSTVGTVSTCAAPSLSAIKIYLTPSGGRTFSFVPPQAESEKGSVLRGTALRSGSSYHSIDPRSLRSLKPEWQEEPGFDGRRSVHLPGESAESGAGSEGTPSINCVPLSSTLGEESKPPQHTGPPLSPMSNFSWQPLSDVGRQDDDDLFPENLMLTEQSDLGLLRNKLAQVLPEENINRQMDSRHAAGQPSRNEELQGIRDIPEQHSFQHPSLATNAHVGMQQVANGPLFSGTGGQSLDPMDTGRSDDHTVKPRAPRNQLGPERTSTPSIVETVYWDAQDDLADAEPTLSVQYLKTLDDAENHDMHTSEAGVLHTSLSIHTTEPPSTNLQRVLNPRMDTPESATAMTDIMSVAIETVNECAQTAMTTVNRITQISLEQLQAAGHTGSLKSYPLANSSRVQGDLYSQHSVPLSADIHPPTSDHPLAPPHQNLVVRARQGPTPYHKAMAAMETAAEDASASMLAAKGRNRGFSLEGELHSFRQAGLGRRGAGSEPPFHRGPPGGPMSFGADIPHPSARLTAEEMCRRALGQPLQRRDTPALLDGARLSMQKSAPPLPGRPKLKVPPLWTGSSPFEGRMIETVDSEAFSEAQEGMQWVNGKGWVQAEKAFLDSFDSAPPRLRRLDPGPPPLPGIVLPGRRPSPVPEKSVVIKPPSSQAAISSGLDNMEVVQQASREHLLAERRRRATKLAKRGGVPPRATDMPPPPGILPERNLPTAATQADKASRRRSKGGLCGKLVDFCGSLYACRPSKAKRTISYSEASAPQTSHPPSSM